MFLLELIAFLYCEGDRFISRLNDCAKNDWEENPVIVEILEIE